MSRPSTTTKLKPSCNQSIIAGGTGRVAAAGVLGEGSVAFTGEMAIGAGGASAGACGSGFDSSNWPA